LHLGMHDFEEFRGGGNRYLADLNRALNLRSDIDSKILVVHERRVPDRRSVARLVISVWRLSRFNVRALCRIAKVDLIDVHFGPYTLVPVIWARLLGRKVVLHFQGPWADEARSAGDTSRIRWHARRMLEKAVYAQIDVGIVLSRAFAELLATYTRRIAVTVIPPGVDPGWFQEGDGEAAEVPEQRSGRSYVCSVRRLVPRMGIDVLVDAWADVWHSLGVAERRTWRLLIVGDGPMRSELQARAARRQVGDSVAFLGDIDDRALARVYRGAIASVVPTIELEGFGLVVLESLACGTPVIATSTGGLSDALMPFFPEGLCKPNSVGDLAERLARLVSDPGWLPSRVACERYAAEYSWDTIAERHIALYRELIGSERMR
jgi:glycosyltransferase involved in cell wall biosynthesis